MRKRTTILIAALVVAALVGGGLVVFRFFFVKMVKVPTGAMMNTIVPGDHLFVTKALGQIKRGQVVVFQYMSMPPNSEEVRQDRLFKRIE